MHTYAQTYIHTYTHLLTYLLTYLLPSFLTHLITFFLRISSHSSMPKYVLVCTGLWHWYWDVSRWHYAHSCFGANPTQPRPQSDCMCSCVYCVRAIASCMLTMGLLVLEASTYACLHSFLYACLLAWMSQSFYHITSYTDWRICVGKGCGGWLLSRAVLIDQSSSRRHFPVLSAKRNHDQGMHCTIQPPFLLSFLFPLPFVVFNWVAKHLDRPSKVCCYSSVSISFFLFFSPTDFDCSSSCNRTPGCPATDKTLSFPPLSFILCPPFRMILCLTCACCVSFAHRAGFVLLARHDTL